MILELQIAVIAQQDVKLVLHLLIVPIAQLNFIWILLIVINAPNIVMFALVLTNVRIALQDIIYKEMFVLVVVMVNIMIQEVVHAKTVQLDVVYVNRLQIVQHVKQHSG